MSFKDNDSKHFITPENYEEFFILYIDGELSEEQMSEVDEFVNVHPHLKSELQLLLSTKLPAEEISINKEELLSSSMNKVYEEEQLLSFIDNELKPEEAEELNKKIILDTQLQLNYSTLLKTKLDPSESIIYPYKKELYRRTNRRVAYGSFIRIAAILILIAIGLIIFENRSVVKPNDTTAGIKKINTNKVPSVPVTKESIQDITPSVKDLPVATTSPVKQNITNKSSNILSGKNQKKDLQKVISPLVNDKPIKDDIVLNRRSSEINDKTISPSTNVSFVPLNETINHPGVTSAFNKRTTIDTASAIGQNPENKMIADNNHKGSLKSFLRKAARVIEKKTGIDPANENEELLIGAVAVKLN
jgi:hypothetical protein